MITEIRRGYNVKRFHTTKRLQEETVGHHSANVAAILLRLDPDCSRNLLVAALVHDVPEAYTGDVPAPCKWDNPHIKEGLNECERAYMQEYELPWPELTEEEQKLLKVADMLELVISCVEELNMGNSYAKTLVRNGQDYILGLDLPEELLVLVNAMVMEAKADVS